MKNTENIFQPKPKPKHGTDQAATSLRILELQSKHHGMGQAATPSRILQVLYTGIIVQNTAIAQYKSTDLAQSTSQKKMHTYMEVCSRKKSN